MSQTSVDRAIESVSASASTKADGDDADARLERLVRALHHVSPEVERLGRALIRLTVDAATRSDGGKAAPRRGYRRIEWIESALAPWRKRIGPKRWQRLVAALAMVIGWEALIVQRDVCGLTAAEGEALSVWAARALLHETLRDIDAR